MQCIDLRQAVVDTQKRLTGDLGCGAASVFQIVAGAVFQGDRFTYPAVDRKAGENRDRPLHADRIVGARAIGTGKRRAALRTAAAAGNQIERRIVAGTAALDFAAGDLERQLLAERYLQMALQNRAQQYGKTFSTGPNGETPELAVNIKLSDEELARIRAMQAKAAIVMHYAGNDWSRAQIEGLKAQFAVMGLEVVAVSDAGFQAEQQVKDIEAALALDPQIIVSIPTDPVATAAAYRHAAERGVQLIYMDNVPKGHVAGRDYVSAVSSDNHGNGAASAQLMAKALGGQGEIGLVFHAADFFVTRQRHEAFKHTMGEQYPGIRIVAEQGISGPDFVAQAQLATQAMLAAHPQLKGIWAVWDVPAKGVIAAARTAGRLDLVVTTIDLGQEVAADMARGGNVRGVAAQRVYDQGVTEALLAGYGLLGKAAPAFVALPALPVDKDNLRDAWQIVYRHTAPNFEHITPQGDFL